VSIPKQANTIRTHFLVNTWRRDKSVCQQQARGTHELKIREEGVSPDTERKQEKEGHSQTGRYRGTYKSGHGKKAREQGMLTG
jgi:hypothetical protein